ncbi:LysR family transcriptional regulator [Acinetobacter pullicarnis]|uniref:LysR family transcriptional regulator n=1 Tax=Acinetobacter pullicarnis TaxID=2576829 RepID=UPI001120BDCB|nr:LysR family transcriptional regulator [Acinetobacter pullicarnis]
MANHAGENLNNLSDILIFIRVADSGSFTKAAELLNLSRSAVGKSIQRLETHLSSRLIHRTTRTLSLSDEGTLFYESAQRILQEVADAENLILKRHQTPTGRLRITVPVAFGRLHVMPVLRDFLASYPAIDLEVIFSDDYLDLIHDGIDLAIRFGSLQDSSLIQQRLATHQLISCASPQYLAEHGLPKSLEDLAEHQQLIYLHQGRATPWRYYVQGRDVEYPAYGRIRLYDVEALRDTALAHFGIAQIGAFLISEELAAGRLIPILQDIAPLIQPIYAVYPSKRHLSLKVKSLLQFIEQRWQGQPIWEMAQE